MGIARQITALAEDYKETSIGCMKNLCDIAGVEYRDPEEAKLLVEDMYNKGYKIKVSKYSNKDISVGQYLILTDLDLNVICGYRVYIDFEGYVVRKMKITENEEVPFIR